MDLILIQIYSCRTLNFNKQPLLIGGLVTADPVLERPGQIHSDDLVGCVHSVSVNGRPLNLTSPLKSRGISSTCKRNSNGGACAQSHSEDPGLLVCGDYEGCLDRWHTAMCRCGGHLYSPDCFSSVEPISLSEGGFIEFKINEKHRRMQLLDHLYFGPSTWTDEAKGDREKRFANRFLNNVTMPQALTEDYPKSLSVLFRTYKPDGLILFLATNTHYTSIELKSGRLTYMSLQGSPVNMTDHEDRNLIDGKWHNVTLFSHGRVLKVFVDGSQVGDELDAAGVHDFLDPYLTVLSIGGIRRELYQQETIPTTFEGCLANFTINNEIQPFNGSGSVFKDVQTSGKVYQGCHGLVGIGSAQVTDPLSIGITLVIVFFVILLVAIFASFVVFRLRKQNKEKHGGPSGHGMHSKQNGTGAYPSLATGADCVLSRGIHSTDSAMVGYHNDSGDLLRSVGHHLVGPELLTKKFKEREIIGDHQQRPQRPDIIEREVVSKSPPLRDDHHPHPIPPPGQPMHSHDHQSTVDMGSDYPEHYDLENASSIAPSDIDIVYHYKGYREAAAVRKYKANPPPVASYHKHQTAGPQQQPRHSPHHPSAPPFGPRLPPQSGQSSVTPIIRQHQSTPLARLSPSSEMSSQQPRILTLHDISGKPLQTALLAATTSSSAGVGKDALHSNSERSLNSPVMSQLSGSSASRKNPGGGPPHVPNGVRDKVNKGPMGLTAEEIERLNGRPRTSSLVSTLDAVSSSSEAPRGPVGGHHLSHMHHSPVAVDAHSSTSTDESGNDSFTCSEIEYDNNSMNGDSSNKYKGVGVDSGNRRGNDNGSGLNKPPIPPPSYDGFDSSFRGSLSTLVASDDDLSSHMSGLYRHANGASPGNANAALGWDYLLNWGPNFESLMGVFKDIAELPDTVNGHVPTLRLSSAVQKPSEEYV